MWLIPKLRIFPASFPVFFSAIALLALTSSAAAQSSSPQSNYLQHCAGCHLVDGSGLPPEVPSLRNDIGYLIDSDEGRGFMVRVPGVTMVPISAEAVVDLLNWIVVTFDSDGGEFEPFTLDEVIAGRADPLHDPLKARRELFPDLEL
jgi:hypothetical protein